MADATSQTFAFARRHRPVDQPISYLMAKALANPDLISLAAGFVDYDTLPADEVRTLLDKLLHDPRRARAALQYGTTAGLPELRDTLYQHLAQLDGTAADAYPGSPDHLVVSTGSQQLLHILTDLLVDPDDIVITARPSYFVYTGALASLHATVRTVPMDEHGLIPEALDELLTALARIGQLPRVKIVYACAYHQNPTGLTLAADRRPRLLEVVQRHSTHHRILLIEDAAYRELTYEGEPPPSIKSFDTDNQSVALLQTFSKPFAPGLKTGYGLLPDDLVEPVLRAKGGRDFGSANLCQHLLLDAMQTGTYAKHVQRLRHAYAAKRNAMLSALDEHLGQRDGTTWTHPTGGLYVWLTLPDTIDTGRDGPLFHHAIREGVLFVPGTYCYPPDPGYTAPTHTLRLSFGVPTPDQIHQGITRLARALQRLTHDA